MAKIPHILLIYTGGTIGMVKDFKNNNYWALILGGSSGLGLATAKKLAHHGMNICVVHRNSRFQEAEITLEFNKIKTEGVQFVSFNMDAINPEKRNEITKRLESISRTKKV